MNKDERIYLDTYIVQKDMRIRLPRSAIENLDLVKGVTFLDIYLDKKKNELVLRRKEINEEDGDK